MAVEKDGWIGPLVEATDGMGVGAIADALGYSSIGMVENIMTDPEKQVDLKASRYRSLYQKAPIRNKPLIEKFFLDDLLLA